MELPSDIWGTILQKINSYKDSVKLFLSLPNNVKKDLMQIYEIHISKISPRILVSYNNNVSVYNNIEPIFQIDCNDVKIVRFRHNHNEIAIAQGNGKIMFWNYKTNENTMNIQLKQKFINNLEFHPNGKIMVTRAGDFLKIWIFEENGKINFRHWRDDFLFYNLSFLFHPIKPNLYIARYRSNDNEIIDLYDWKYSVQDRYEMIDHIILPSYHDVHYYLPIKFSYDWEKIENIMDFKAFGNRNFGGVLLNRISIYKANRRPFTNNIMLDLYTKKINDYFWNGDKFYYCKNCIIEKDTITNLEKCIYKSSEQIKKMYCKNNSIIFIDGNEFKMLDLQTHSVDILITIRGKLNDYNLF